MLDIINDQTISEKEKVIKYNSTLADFQTLSEKNLTSAVFNTTKSASTSSQSKAVDHTLAIPKQYKTKAQNLIEILQSSRSFKINNKGEVIINHQLLEGSNASDLLNKAVNANSKIQFTPGWDTFQSYLQSENIPQTLLHKSLKQEIAKTKSEPPIIANSSKNNKPGKSKKPRWSPY